MTIKVKLLEPIEGYSDIAEYRRVMEGDFYFNSLSEEFIQASGDFPRHGYGLVLTPIPKWRPATLEDGIRAIRGETIKARFREGINNGWSEGELATVWPEPHETRWGKRNSGSWRYCEVLDV